MVQRTTARCAWPPRALRLLCTSRDREGLGKGPRAGKGEAGIYVAREVLVTEEGLLVQLEDAHLC